MGIYALMSEYGWGHGNPNLKSCFSLMLLFLCLGGRCRYRKDKQPKKKKVDMSTGIHLQGSTILANFHSRPERRRNREKRYQAELERLRHVSGSLSDNISSSLLPGTLAENAG